MITRYIRDTWVAQDLHIGSALNYGTNNVLPSYQIGLAKSSILQ